MVRIPQSSEGHRTWLVCLILMGCLVPKRKCLDIVRNCSKVFVSCACRCWIIRFYCLKKQNQVWIWCSKSLSDRADTSCWQGCEWLPCPRFPSLCRMACSLPSASKCECSVLYCSCHCCSWSQTHAYCISSWRCFQLYIRIFFYFCF